MLMPGVTLTAVPHSFLSNCPERSPQEPWGKGPRPGAHRNLCIGETLLSAWWAAAHFLGVRQMVWSQHLLPAMLSLPQSLRVWHLEKQRLEILLADLLLQGQAPKQAQSQPKKTKQHLRAFSKIQSCVPVAPTRDWDSSIWGSEVQNTSRFIWNEMRLSIWGVASSYP